MFINSTICYAYKEGNKEFVYRQYIFDNVVVLIKCSKVTITYQRSTASNIFRSAQSVSPLGKFNM